MADDALRQLYVKAARSLSIAHEVYQHLKTRRLQAEVVEFLRLDLEAEIWQPTLDALDAHNLALSEFSAANAVWEISGHIGVRPESPKKPAELPDRPTYRTEYFFETIRYLKRSADAIGNAIRDKSERDFDAQLSIMATELEYIGKALRSIKTQIDEDSDETNKPPEKTTSADKATDSADYITVSQMARLAGIGVGGMNNRLSESRPDAQPVRPGGRKHNAYPWPAIREWMVRNWPSRTIPEDFQKLQELLQELPPP